MVGAIAAWNLLWERRPEPRRGPRPTLTLDAIAAAGIEIADADGLAAVTMQRVAERLGVTKMALYRYVPGKVELVALMTDHAMGEPPRPAGPPAGWRERLDAWARELLDRFLAHPWTLEATVGPRALGPNEVGWLEQVTDALTGTGLTGPEMLDVAVTLIGHVRAIAQQASAVPVDAPERTMGEALTALLSGREERYPTFAAALAGRDGRGRAFDFGLSCILDGVAALAGRRGQERG
jgi:Transcriptional regulator